MKTSKIFLLSFAIALCGHSQIFTISLKQMICAGLSATGVTSHCTIYNTMKEDVMIVNGVSMGFFRFPLSVVGIPAKTYRGMCSCNLLSVGSHRNSDTKKIGLAFKDQPRGCPRVFTVSQEPCRSDCHNATTQVSLTPGFPESYLSSYGNQTSPMERLYLDDQLQYNPGDETHTCNLRRRGETSNLRGRGGKK